SPTRRWTLAMPRRVVRTGTRLPGRGRKYQICGRPQHSRASRRGLLCGKRRRHDNRKELTMNVAMKSIAEAPPPRSDPAPTTPEPSTREIIRNLTRELREDVGEQAVETVVAANPLVGL